MPKQYPLKVYIKAVEKIALTQGFAKIEYWDKKGSVVRFDLFMVGQDIPCALWQVHTLHTKRREVYSKEDFRKAAKILGVSIEEFQRILRN